jgi:hypothetical protein
MRFDPEQALAHLRALDHPRIPGSVEERRAADYVAKQLAQLGWTVQRDHVNVSLFFDVLARRLTWPAIGLAMTSQTILRAADRPDLTWFGCLLVALLCWHAALVPVAARLGQVLPPRVASENLFATRPLDPPTAARVVFLANLDTESDHLPRQLRSFISWIVLFLIILVSMVNAGRMSPIPSYAGPGLLAVLWLFVLVRAGDGLVRRLSTRAADNRSGLAALLELAHTLPSSLKERVEIEFAALGLQSLDHAGARALSGKRSDIRLAKPTLYIHLIAPESRNEIILVGRGDALSLAESAAKGLWIPHRVAPRTGSWSDCAIIAARLENASCVCLIGDTAFDRERLFDQRSHAACESDHAALGIVVQLATEIALRWARLHDQVDPGASLARSSQKPG